MQPITGLIVAGGRSSRFGHDKALVRWRGQPLLLRAVERIRPLVGQVMVAVGPKIRYTELLPSWATPIADAVADAGPLAGIAAGLAAADGGPDALLLTVAVDLPLARAEFLTRLLSESAADLSADAVVPRLAGRVHPLLAVYRRRALPAAEAALSIRRLRMTEWLSELRVRYLTEPDLLTADPELRSVCNVNTPEDLAAIAAIAPLEPPLESPLL